MVRFERVRLSAVATFRMIIDGLRGLAARIAGSQEGGNYQAAYTGLVIFTAFLLVVSPALFIGAWLVLYFYGERFGLFAIAPEGADAPEPSAQTATAGVGAGVWKVD